MSMTRRLLTVVLVSVLGCLAVGAQAPPKQAGGEAKVTWYFYTVKWGLQDEYLDLFQRNHYPILKAKEKAGRYASFRRRRRCSTRPTRASRPTRSGSR